MVCEEQSVLLVLTVQDMDALFKTCPRLVYNMWRVGMGQLRQAAIEGSEQASGETPQSSPRQRQRPARWFHLLGSKGW